MINVADNSRRHAKALGLLLAAALIFLAGCTGIATKDETAAREDFRVVTARYRPQEAKPPLPALTPESGLGDLLRYALLNNPRVEAAYHAWAASVEEITTARSLPDPMLNFGLEISRGVAAFTPTLMSDPGENWPGPGKLPLKAEAAYADSLRRRALFEDEMLSAALAVKRAWYQMWVLGEQIRWTGDTLTLVNEIEALARSRLAAGQVTQQDVLRAQMERDQLRTRLANLEDGRSTVLARLRAALGLPPSAPLPALTWKLEPAPADWTEESLLEIAFTRNPRLKAMQGEVRQAVALMALARKTTVPDYSWGIGVNTVPSPAAIMPSFGISLPLWRDKVAAEIARGGAGVGEARARLSAEELDLAVRFAEAAYAWREADRNVTLYGERLAPKARASVEAARAGYAAGLTPFIDLLDAERTLLEYRLNHASAAGQRETALAEMSLAILGRWPGEVPVILGESSK